jgi:hypothetical protein
MHAKTRNIALSVEIAERSNVFCTRGLAIPSILSIRTISNTIMEPHRLRCTELTLDIHALPSCDIRHGSAPHGDTSPGCYTRGRI